MSNSLENTLERNSRTVPLKSGETERVALAMTSPRLDRARRHVMELQDTYLTAQQKVNQLSHEYQLHSNKPEHQQCCHTIRKNLCDKINEVVWKQKDYERENRKLERMLDRRTYTRIEKAYVASSVPGSAADNSTSYDQGLLPGTSNAPIRLTTKEKIKQLQVMLHDLEDEVNSPTQEEGHLHWESSDESEVEKNKKSGQTITLAQAKLAKELIKLANTYKVPELTFNDKARTRRSGCQTWFNKLRPILAMFEETSSLIQGEKIHPFADGDCIGNKALFLLIGSRVDSYFQHTIRKYEGKGDQALIFIKNQCASTTADDTHHFHYLFTSLRIKENESATNFFRRFTFAWTEAE